MTSQLGKKKQVDNCFLHRKVAIKSVRQNINCGWKLLFVFADQMLPNIEFYYLCHAYNFSKKNLLPRATIMQDQSTA